MANKFLRALAKAKLIELGEDEAHELSESATSADEVDMAEIDKILAAEAAAERAAKAPPPVEPPKAAAPTKASGVGPMEIPEGTPFEETYASAGIPPAAYSAEKLLKVLDGLKAMDPATRKAAVLAMDAADDDWSVADAVLDAERKSRALNESVQTLSDRLTQIADRARQEQDKRDAYLKHATEQIQTKIREFEETLQNESTEVAAQKAEIAAQLQAAQAACQREVARLSGEVGRLAEIPATFAIDRNP